MDRDDKAMHEQHAKATEELATEIKSPKPAHSSRAIRTLMRGRTPLAMNKRRAIKRYQNGVK